MLYLIGLSLIITYPESTQIASAAIGGSIESGAQMA